MTHPKKPRRILSGQLKHLLRVKAQVLFQHAGLPSVERGRAIELVIAAHARPHELS